MYSNLLLLGMNIDLDSLNAETVFGIEYFGMRRRAKEEEEKFKLLGKMIGGK